jgi:hypothetical protein
MLRVLLYISTFLSVLLFGMIFYSIFIYLQSTSSGRHEILIIGAYGTLWLLSTITINLVIKYFFKLNASKLENFMVWFPVAAIVIGNGIQYMLI